MVLSKKKTVLVLILIFVGLAAAVFFVKIYRPKNDLTKLLNDIRTVAAVQKNYNLALNKASALAKKYPALSEAWQWVGISDFQLGKFAESKTAFEKAIALDSKNITAKNYLELIPSADKGTISVAKNLSRQAFESISNIKLSNDFEYAIGYSNQAGVAAISTGKYRTTLSKTKVQDQLEKDLHDAKLAFEKMEDKSGVTIYRMSAGKYAALISFNYSISPKIISITVNK